MRKAFRKNNPKAFTYESINDSQQSLEFQLLKTPSISSIQRAQVNKYSKYPYISYLISETRSAFINNVSIYQVNLRLFNFPGMYRQKNKLVFQSIESTSILLLTFVALNGVLAQVPFPGKCPEVKIMDEFDVEAVSGHPTNCHYGRRYLLVEHF